MRLIWKASPELTYQPFQKSLFTGIASVSARWRPKTATVPPIAPATPCTMPSSMNGTRTNQFDAPTSFITSISRLRAKVANRIVFTMRNSEAKSSSEEDQR